MKIIDMIFRIVVHFQSRTIGIPIFTATISSCSNESLLCLVCVCFKTTLYIYPLILCIYRCYCTCCGSRNGSGTTGCTCYRCTITDIPVVESHTKRCSCRRDTRISCTSRRHRTWSSILHRDGVGILRC